MAASAQALATQVALELAMVVQEVALVAQEAALDMVQASQVVQEGALAT